MTSVFLRRLFVNGKMSGPSSVFDSGGAEWINKTVENLQRIALHRSFATKLSAEGTRRLQRCITFCDQHGIQGFLGNPDIIIDVLELILEHLPDMGTWLIRLLSFAAAFRKESACEIVLRSHGPWSNVFLIDWRVNAFRQPERYRKHFRLKAGHFGSYMFPMLLRTYHSELNTSARGCLHIMYVLGSTEELLALLCAGANKLAAFPGISTRVFVLNMFTGDQSPDVTLSCGETVLDTAHRCKEQVNWQEKYELLMTFQLTLVELCLITIRKEVGRLMTGRIQALKLPPRLEKRLLFEPVEG